MGSMRISLVVEWGKGIVKGEMKKECFVEGFSTVIYTSEKKDLPMELRYGWRIQYVWDDMMMSRDDDCIIEQTIGNDCKIQR